MSAELCFCFCGLVPIRCTCTASHRCWLVGSASPPQPHNHNPIAFQYPFLFPVQFKHQSMAANPIDRTPAEAVASSEDLLSEILSYVPIISLLRLKCVSRSWLNLISNYHFSLLHCRRHPNPTCSGLFFHQSLSRSSSTLSTSFDFIRLDIGTWSSRPLRFISQLNSSGMKILQSCNGLLLCCSNSSSSRSDSVYHICNPAINQISRITLPDAIMLDNRVILGMNLAYDPSKSCEYRVICVWMAEENANLIGIDVYSPSTKRWSSAITVGSLAPFDVEFERGVFWNGKIHWLSHTDSSVFFDLETNCVKPLTLPAAIEGAYIERFRYFGESHGHLHLIEIRTNCVPEFDVLEMDRDSMAWFVKYRVNLDLMGFEFGEMFQDYRDRFGRNSRFYAFSVLSVVRGEEEDDSRLIVSIPGKVISYNFETKATRCLSDVIDGSDRWMPFKGYNSYQFIESLLCV